MQKNGDNRFLKIRMKILEIFYGRLWKVSGMVWLILRKRAKNLNLINTICFI